MNLSARPLSHADRLTPSFRAVPVYAAFSAGVQRNLTTSVAGSLRGGLPFGRLSMPPIMWLQIILDKWVAGVFNVATLNKEMTMNAATLKAFREIGYIEHNWEWISKNDANRMVNISEARAKEYAKLYGGTARRMA